MSTTSKLKARLEQGPPLFGAWALSTSADNTEALAYAGLDFVILDHEHGQGSIDIAIHQLRSLKGTDCFGVLRVPSNDHVYIKRALDAGVDAVLVPNVTTAEEAARVVAATCYAPAGIRGVFAGMRATHYGADADYHRTANSRQLVIVQVESVVAIDNIPRIAQIEGVDVIFIGPRDLSATLGHVNEFDHPEVRAQIQRAEELILRSGKTLGSIARDGAEAWRMAARGYSFIACGSDMSLLRLGALAMLREAKAAHEARKSA